MVRRDAAKQGLLARNFSVWGIALWVVLLLAAFGALQYLKIAAYLYLAVAFAIIVVCAGCVLRQEWARRTMCVLAPLIALWMLVSGGQMLAAWGQFAAARESAMAQPMADVVMPMIDQAQRTYLLGLIFKGLEIPLLLWLAWRLGRPAVRAQFHQRQRG
ncbi:hypothetical protein DVJ77_17935 [Dyella tabacisoli]|uniref:Uncharacterized protein n=2 Tax=Dyella tabacisoli TaxID=2282381 RepID=A0A369UJR7_9GAMM|nr:hypothetical protein DVJ77_17935 [Dyella tabacisoli]